MQYIQVLMNAIAYPGRHRRRFRQGLPRQRQVDILLRQHTRTLHEEGRQRRLIHQHCLDCRHSSTPWLDLVQLVEGGSDQRNRHNGRRVRTGQH